MALEFPMCAAILFFSLLPAALGQQPQLNRVIARSWGTRVFLPRVAPPAARPPQPGSGGGQSRFEWIGEHMAYPPPKPGEDLAILGPLSDYFRDAGIRIHGDTYPMTWAGDGEIYTSSGDPHWGGKLDGLDVEKISGVPPGYVITRVNPMLDYRGNGGEGPKPSGMICVRGVVYLAFQNLLGKKPPVHGEKCQHGSDAAIVRSNDHGKTWAPAIKDIRAPMFPGSAFGGPAFVNFGRDNAGARDGYIYAVSTDQWDNGSHLRVGRVPEDRILEAGAWEFVAGFDAGGAPKWSRSLREAAPVLSDDRRISLPDIVYLASIRRYVLLTWRLKKDFSPDDGSELMIYESPEPWGPFTLVHHDRDWESPEVTPYCPRQPLKWVTASRDAFEGWILFSGSWRPNSRHYLPHVRKFRMTVTAR